MKKGVIFEANQPIILPCPRPVPRVPSSEEGSIELRSNSAQWRPDCGTIEHPGEARALWPERGRRGNLLGASPAGRSLSAVLAALLLCAHTGGAAEDASRGRVASHAALPTLTTAAAAHNLSTLEANRGYPIHLRGVVTYFDPGRINGHFSVFLHDRTGSIYTTAPTGSMGPFPVGSLIDISGVSRIGGFGPILADPKIRIVGSAPLPPPDLKVNYSKLVTGAEDGMWVQAEGTVHSVTEYLSTVTLVLCMVDGTIDVTMMKDAGADYSQLVDARVRIAAHAAPTINSNNQMVGAHLMAPNRSTIKVLEPAPGDAFQAPVVPVDDLLRWNEVAAWTHRVHVRGTVTLAWPGSFLCVRDATGAICAKTAEQRKVGVGDVVDLAGFAGAENDAPVLTYAQFRVAAAASGTAPDAQPVSAEQALLGAHQSKLVQIEGRFIGRDQNAADLVLELSSGKYLFAAVLPKSFSGPATDAWEVGSTVRVTGICAVQLDMQSDIRDGKGVAKTFRVLMRSPADVAVLQRPSWWTPVHAVFVLSLGLVTTLAVLVWVATLRRRLEIQAALLRKQTELLSESEERFRHMALHDPLTGLATRTLLQDRFKAALEANRRDKTGLALLMVDLDRFKEINDTYGHAAGDDVLCSTADRIVDAVRKVDTVARLGGDEFVVLLAGLHETQTAERIAAKLVENLSVPISSGGREISISVSVGLFADPAGRHSSEALLDGADAALYRAKNQGRNCYRVFTPELQGGSPAAELAHAAAK